MCWFARRGHDERRRARARAGLGLLPGSLSVHLDSEPERLPVYRGRSPPGALPPGYAVDDGAALLFDGTRLSACVASRAGARVIRRAAPTAHGGVVEQEMPVKLLPGAEAITGRSRRRSAYGVSELRALRAGRHRWD